jgi:hypothetical protein
MSALGQKQTFTHCRPMSALPPIADIKLPPRLSARTVALGALFVITKERRGGR